MSDLTKYCDYCQKSHPRNDEFWYFKNDKPSNCKKRKADYRKSKSEETKAYLAEYRESPERKIKAKKANDEWREANREQYRKQSREYMRTYRAARPKQKITEKQKEQYRHRYRTDIEFKIRTNLRNRLRMALKRGYKTGSAIEALGCSIQEFKFFLEGRFHPNPETGEQMAWENHGLHGWHIDHIKPLDSFDLTDPRQFSEACHHTNQTPTWAKWNLAKGALVRPDLRALLEADSMQVTESGPVLWIKDKIAVTMIPLQEGLDPLRVRISAKLGGNRIIQFYESEVRDMPDIVLSILRSVCGGCETIDARECEIRSIRQAEAHLFMTRNHLVGPLASTTSFALFYNDEPVAVMSCRRQVDGWLEIGRFTTKKNLNVMGAFSRLTMYVAEQLKTIGVRSYCDLRYGDGQSYEINGFIRVSESQGFVWSDGIRIYNRLECKANMDERGLSQNEHAEELGWFKIPDAGQARYEKLLIKS